MTYDDVVRDAARRHLTVMGGFHPTKGDAAPPDCKTLLLLGPCAATFWPAFETAPESLDGLCDPMDRWSMRVIGSWARRIGAVPLYPFGGEPFLPFFSWARRSGRIHPSPIMLLVHDTAGLWVSFRGALALRDEITLPPAPPSPCTACLDKPCLTACPVAAFDGTSYDVPTCKSHLNHPNGTDCMILGCAARRSCPISQTYPHPQAQAAYHMRQFKG